VFKYKVHILLLTNDDTVLMENIFIYMWS